MKKIVTLKKKFESSPGKFKRRLKITCISCPKCYTFAYTELNIDKQKISELNRQISKYVLNIQEKLFCNVLKDRVSQ